MREICIDTETTGIEPRDGHKIIEIACFELINKVKTGRFFHSYVNPKRDVPFEAFRIHGISTEFLTDKPVFGEIADEFLEFVQDAPLVIHNAAFDLKFLNYELSIIGKEPLDSARAIDSLQIARKKFPGGQNSLDALCRRFGISLSGREKHGAKIDTELLCEVYLELCGGAQSSLGFDKSSQFEKKLLATTNKINSAHDNIKNFDQNSKQEKQLQNQQNLQEKTNKSDKKFIAPRDFSVSESEIEEHKKFIIDNFKQNFWGY